MSKLDQLQNIKLINDSSTELASQLIISLMSDIEGEDVFVGNTLHHVGYFIRNKTCCLNYNTTTNRLGISLTPNEWEDTELYKLSPGPYWFSGRQYRFIMAIKMEAVDDIKLLLRTMNTLLKQIKDDI